MTDTHSTQQTPLVEIPYLSVRDFALAFGFSEQHVYVLIRRGVIPAARIGKRIFIHEETLSAFMAAQELACAPKRGEA